MRLTAQARQGMPHGGGGGAAVESARAGGDGAAGESARVGKGRRSRVGCARRVGAPPGRGGARERKQIQVKLELLIP